MTDHDEQYLRDLLRDTVDGLEPGDGLPTIRRRIEEDPMSATRGPRAAWLALAGAAAVAVVVTGVVLVTQDTDPASSDAPPAATGTPDATPTTPAPSPTDTAATPDGAPATTRTLPVYYVGDTPVGPRLFREFHRVDVVGDDDLSAALKEAVGTTPLDPDYRTPWPAGTTVAGATSLSSEQVVVVDLTGAAPGALRARPAGMSRAEARMAVEQLVHTAQAVLQDRAPVRITLDGSVTDQVLGVPASEPLANGDAMEVQSTVWITSPQDGDVVGSDVEVTGRGAFFEANVSWQLLRGGDVVDEGFATAAECCTLAPYEFTIRGVAPGDYVLRVYDADVSGGEGPGENEDTKRLTVR